MDDERDAKAAIDELNGTTIDGQEVKVELSKPRSGGNIRFNAKIRHFFFVFFCIFQNCQTLFT